MFVVVIRRLHLYKHHEVMMHFDDVITVLQYFKKHKRKYSRLLAFIYNAGVNKFPQQLFKMFSDRNIVFFLQFVS